VAECNEDFMGSLAFPAVESPEKRHLCGAGFSTKLAANSKDDTWHKEKLGGLKGFSASNCYLGIGNAAAGLTLPLCWW